MKMKTNTRRTRSGTLALGVTALLACGVFAAACGGEAGERYNTTAAPSGVTSTAATAGPAQPSDVTGVKVGDTALGKVFTDAGGFTLYTFTKDVAGSGKSAAEAQAVVWPPLSLDAAPSNVAGATGAWAVFTRADGKRQVTYNGSPLYTYAGDQAPGDTQGDKVGGVWFASIASQRSANAPATASMPTTQSEAPAVVTPPTVAAPPVATPSLMQPATVAPEPTKAMPAPKPTLTPYQPPSGGNGYGY